ncbi:MAG: CsbD family protein [Hyphomicrobiales bacterium]|nr:CsbD family protein [Hyphomicrobiales bacterium]
MGSTQDKMDGLGNQAIGNAKQGLGKLTGDEKLKAEGKAQELKGDVQEAIGDAKSAVKKAVDKSL